MRAEWTDVHLSGRPQGGAQEDIYVSKSVHALSCRLGSFIIFASLISVVGVFLEARRPLYGSHNRK